MKKKWFIGLVSIISAITLAACGTNQDEGTNNNENDKATSQQEETNTDKEKNSKEESEMEHSSSGEVPENLKEAENPKYEVGSKAIIEADHMEGMKGAEATIKGAYDTTVYMVTYTPTDGGEKVENHKWVTEDELSPVEE